MSDEVLFGKTFLEDHAGLLVGKPEISLVELVANSWDAGATEVKIVWPKDDGKLSIEDNGTGMSESQFHRAWKTLNYDRISNQGSFASFPSGRKKKRQVYGCNGKGRHSMFCFSNEYWVETWQEGTANIFHVMRDSGSRPWNIEKQNSFQKPGNGTKIYCDAKRGIQDIDDIRTLLGSKFIADPEFKVFVDGTMVKFEELTAGLKKESIYIHGNGPVYIYKVKSEKGRTAKQHGLAWWVNGRLVGEPSWNVIGGSLLDGRKGPAKSLIYIIIIDFFQPKEDIQQDWSAFISSQRTQLTHREVAKYIRVSLHEELGEERRNRKIEILQKNKAQILKMSEISKQIVTTFIEDVQLNCPTIKDHVLENISSLLIKLEQSRSGYEIISKLSRTSASDLDGWNSIMDRYTLSGARLVLEELQGRLELIAELEKLIEDHETDELHELQPLFEKGLWIFGPEYEGVEFRSNRWISSIVRDLFGDNVVKNPKIRPDFVALPDSSIGVYARSSYDESGEVSGYSKVAIVELKKGASSIGMSEMYQTMKYAHAISNSGKVQKYTEIFCFVLGAKLSEDSREPLVQGNIHVIPRPYNVILKQAHARTFNLLEEIRKIPDVVLDDEDLSSVLQQGELF